MKSTHARLTYCASVIICTLLAPALGFTQDLDSTFWANHLHIASLHPPVWVGLFVGWYQWGLVGYCLWMPKPIDGSKVKSHLLSVCRYNLKRSLRSFSNPQRPSYALGNEGCLLLCNWPRGSQPSLLFAYSNEVWTGIEYQVASHLIFEGFVNQGLDIVRLTGATATAASAIPSTNTVGTFLLPRYGELCPPRKPDRLPIRRG